METTGFDAFYSHHGADNTWSVAIDGKYTEAIRDYLIDDGIPEDGVSKIIENAAKTLGYCPNPQTNEECKKTGIVIGKVQSGKTSNFIAVTALAFDNDYDVVVVLGGTKKPLVTQNRDRIKEYFANRKEVLVLDTVEFRGELTTKKIQQFIKNGKKVIIVALKNTTQIQFVQDNVFKGSSLVDKPLLIIDDEGDEASLNTLVSKGKKSPTYSAIESFKNLMRRHCYISVTATPQANLLIDTLDILSPDFGVLVDPGKGYCGLDVFHSDDTYTVKIPDDESSLLDDGIPNSFIKALSMFFVACAIQKSRGMKPGDKMSMLVHPSQLKADHKSVFKKVDELVNNWIEMSNDKNDISYEDVRSIFVDAYDEYASTTVSPIPSFEDIEDDIILALNMCGKHIVNGDSVSKSADDIYDYNIYVGGTMLGRGLTLKGLTITYIIRTAKGVSAADTVQQRARWFGYKTKYLDLCRVFAVSKILNEFKDIRDHEEDLWDTVRRSNLQARRFKDMSRIFVLSDKLRMTRRGVATSTNFTFSFWNKQRYFQDVAEYIDNNQTILNNFKQLHSSDLYIIQIGSGAPYTICHSDFKTVYQQVLSKFIFPSKSKLNGPLVDKLYDLITRKKINPEIDIIWMRDKLGETSDHDIDSEGKIPNYSVGRRPQDVTKPAVYQGDDNHFVKPDTMQLQIHLIKDKASAIVSPTLALYLPETVISKLTNLVIKG